MFRERVSGSLAILPSSPPNGFTLIELLVTITVMTLMLGLGLAGYLQFEQQQRVQQAARDVQQLFVKTRRAAQVKDQSACEAGVGEYIEVADYTVSVKGSSRIVSSSSTCIDQATNSEIPVTSATILLPSSVVIEPSEFSLKYAPLTARANIIGGGNCALNDNCMIVLKDSDNTNTMFGFTVSRGGQIGGLEPVSEETLDEILEMMEQGS